MPRWPIQAEPTGRNHCGWTRAHPRARHRYWPTVTPIGPNRYLIWGRRWWRKAGPPTDRQQSNIGQSFTPTQQTNLPLCDKPYACSNTACETAYHAATRINDRSADGQGGVAQVIISGGIVGHSNDNGQSLNLTPAFNAQAQAPGNLFVLAIGERGRDFTPICFDGRPSPSPARAFHSSTRVGDEVIIAGGWVVGEDETFQACSLDASAMNSNACGTGNTCVGYRCYLGQPGPGSFFESNAWYSLSALLQPSAANGQFLPTRGHGRLAKGRLDIRQTQPRRRCRYLWRQPKIQFHGG